MLTAITMNSAYGGVTNPDISVIGQARTFRTDEESDVNRNRGQISFEEVELLFDAALNPFARGTFVFAVANDAVEVEEGYLVMTRGLPAGWGLKLGKYRAGFGKLNPVHPHAYPFLERFRVLEAYLPGEEAYNEIGAQISYRLPLPGSIASTLSADVFQGNSFHPDEEDQARPALLGRWSNFFMLSGASSMEVGFSATRGINHVSQNAITDVFGLDAKAKLWFSPWNVLVIQGEALLLNREEVSLDSISQAEWENIHSGGFYMFADYTMKKRYNFGAKYERYQRPESTKPWDQSAGIFAGLALMEETTIFRLNWDHYIPSDGDPVNTYTLQVVFSMGPHKPHQF